MKHKLITRALPIIISSCLLFTGCQSTDTTTETKDTPKNTSSKTEKQDDNVKQVKNDENEKKDNTDKPKENKKPLNQKVVKVNYDEIVNKGMFKNFTDKQLSTLKKNGFVVLQNNNNYTYRFMHSEYEHSEYDNVPTFITTDVVLNMYHIFYGDSMKVLEKTTFYTALGNITNRLLANTVKLYEKSNDKIKPYYEKLLTYYYTSAKLLYQDYKITKENDLTNKKDLYGSEIDTKEQQLNYLEFNKIDKTIPKPVKELAKVELDRIKNFDKVKFEEHSIFGYDIDYSQYKPRGHYNKSQELKNYFRTMINYSLGGFPLTSDEEISKDSYIISMLMTASILNDKSIQQDYDKIYKITSLYSGKSDDLSYLDGKKIIDEVYQDKANGIIAGNAVDILLDKKYHDKALTVIKTLPKPKIVPKIATEENKDIKPCTERQIKFMGQRFNFDSLAIQTLAKPGKRADVRAYDIMHVLGSDIARQVLDDMGNNPAKRWDEYETKVTEMKKLYQEHNKKFVTDDLYHAWIDAISTVLSEKIEGYVPYFMTTKPYEYKVLSSGLGSYAELKHDNVLYSKQVMAEMGGGGDEPLYAYHYLEPNTKLYKNLLELVSKTNNGLKENNINNKSVMDSIVEMEKVLKLFVTVSEKELNNQKVTDSEMIELQNFGGTVDYINSMLKQASCNYEYLESNDAGTCQISDIYTLIGHGYLELGVGKPYSIYALVPINGKSVLAVGSVYSPCDFYSKSTRLTDEEWQKLNGFVQNEYALSYEEKNDKFDIFKYLPYAKEYISDEPNNVDVESIELDWGVKAPKNENE